MKILKRASEQIIRKVNFIMDNKEKFSNINLEKK